MAITVKDITGQEHNVATRGVAIAGLTTGIIGSALGALNSGMLGGLGSGGLFGNNVASTAATALEAMGLANVVFINKDQYYTDRITDIRTQNAIVSDLSQQICSLRERAAVSETANSYQNRIVDIGFANVDNRFGTERQITEFQIDAKTCNYLQARKVYTPDQIAETFGGATLALDYHRTPASSSAMSAAFAGSMGGYGMGGYGNPGMGCNGC